jgi:hypothetical protein
MVVMRHIFAQAPAGQTVGQIIRWWEARRLHYNVVVFASILLAWVIASWPVSQEGWRGFSSLVGISIVVFLIPANIWYTCGWAVDLSLKRWLRKPWTGFAPWALGAGMAFSAAFVIALIVWVSHAKVNI